jgi:hypothetical protein
MTDTQFDWIVRELSELAVARARKPVPLRLPIDLSLQQRLVDGFE